MTGPRVGECLSSITEKKRLEELAPLGELVCRARGCGAHCIVNPTGRQMIMAEIVERGSLSNCVNDGGALWVTYDDITRTMPK